MRNRYSCARRIKMERTTHAAFVDTSLRHPRRSVPHGVVDTNAAQRHAKVIRLTMRWMTVEYTPKRISRRFSLHEAKIIVEANATRTTCRMLAIANAA